MDENNRREVLERLYQELQQVKPTDEHGQQVLADALVDIQRVLDPNDPTATLEDEGFAERLQDTVYHFESTHPDIASAITVFIDSLANMGL